jgi:tRNA threonylcarbamoyl adenosine modification protein YeaZ
MLILPPACRSALTNMGDQMVLGIDTSTVVAVGLAAGGMVVAEATVDDRMAHVEQLAVLVKQVAATAGVSLNQLTHIVVGLGPGPFTGLRVGIVTAQVLAATLGVGLRGVCSLDVIAAEYLENERPSSDFIVATDARRSEVYWARYASHGSRVEGPAVNRPGNLAQLPTVGPAADIYASVLAAAPGPRTLSAATLATAGPQLPDAGTQPLYLRRPDATEPARRKSVLLHRGRR